MESRCGSLPNAKPVPKLPDPQPTAGLNETVPVTDRNVDFASGQSNVKNYKLRYVYVIINFLGITDISSELHFYNF